MRDGDISKLRRFSQIFWKTAWKHKKVSGSALALGRTATRPRGAIEKKCGRRPVEALPVGRGAHPTAPEGGRGPREGGFRLCAADGDIGVPGGGKWKNDEGRKRRKGKV